MTPRTLHVEHCMGTVFTIDIRTPGAWDDAVAEVVAWLHHVDAVFSTYRDDSDISRLRRGALRLGDADPEVATVLDLCAEVQVATGGAFTAMPGGRLDPTGLVKGWAVERASALLTSRGATEHAVNGGGDMQLAGGTGGGRPWRVGVADPSDRTALLAVVEARDLAIATSGTAERGAHIHDPFTGRAATGVLSATVAGPSLTVVDAYATAAAVLGRDALPWIADIPGHHLLLVTTDGERLASPGWAALTSTR
ncbi:MAG: FAD:protein FMN transferase [Jatrophihabitans sp.]|uniref:FAD:protein FMN transferase n=1 Tax=Jatrophihabitans sp. TaxID=1932789 RepID=UPI003F804712